MKNHKRDIKFRAYDKLTGKLWQWDEHNAFSDAKGSIKQWFEDSDLIIMQYTGFKDRDGVEVYEGDILGYEDVNGIDYHNLDINGDPTKWFVFVEWDEFQGKWALIERQVPLEGYGADYDDEETELFNIHNDENKEPYKVFGNINYIFAK